MTAKIDKKSINHRQEKMQRQLQTLISGDEASDRLGVRTPQQHTLHTRPPDVQPNTQRVPACRWHPPPSQTVANTKTSDSTPLIRVEAPLFNGDDPLVAVHHHFASELTEDEVSKVVDENQSLEANSKDARKAGDIVVNTVFDPGDIGVKVGDMIFNAAFDSGQPDVPMEEIIDVDYLLRIDSSKSYSELGYLGVDTVLQLPNCTMDDDDLQGAVRPIRWFSGDAANILDLYDDTLTIPPLDAFPNRALPISFQIIANPYQLTHGCNNKFLALMGADDEDREMEIITPDPKDYADALIINGDVSSVHTLVRSTQDNGTSPVAVSPPATSLAASSSTEDQPEPPDTVLTAFRPPSTNTVRQAAPQEFHITSRGQFTQSNRYRVNFVPSSQVSIAFKKWGNEWGRETLRFGALKGVRIFDPRDFKSTSTLKTSHSYSYFISHLEGKVVFNRGGVDRDFMPCPTSLPSPCSPIDQEHPQLDVVASQLQPITMQPNRSSASVARRRRLAATAQHQQPVDPCSNEQQLIRAWSLSTALLRQTVNQAHRTPLNPNKDYFRWQYIFN